MKGSHTAENVLVAIQEILSEFTFNTFKIRSIVCDEGSNLVRLFKMLTSENNFYLNNVEEDHDDLDDADYELPGEPNDDDDDDDDDNDNYEDDEDNDAASSDEEETDQGTFVVT